MTDDRPCEVFAEAHGVSRFYGYAVSYGFERPEEIGRTRPDSDGARGDSVGVAAWDFFRGGDENDVVAAQWPRILADLKRLEFDD